MPADRLQGLPAEPETINHLCDQVLPTLLATDAHLSHLPDPGGHLNKMPVDIVSAIQNKCDRRTQALDTMAI